MMAFANIIQCQFLLKIDNTVQAKDLREET